MSHKVLIDTSIWVEFFRGKDKEVVKMVSDLIWADRAALAGVVLAELIQGVKKESDSKIIEETMTALSYFEVSLQIWKKTGETLKKLRSKGVTLPLSDVLLATIASENDCEILTSDLHFKQIEGISLYQKKVLQG
jgi:hypothetical protein